MKRVSAAIVCSMVLASCQNTDEQVAKNACPFISLTDRSESDERLGYLVDAGMAPKTGMERLKFYEKLSESPSLPTTFDKEVLSFEPKKYELCVAAITNDQERLQVYLEEAQAYEEMIFTPEQGN